MRQKIGVATLLLGLFSVCIILAISEPTIIIDQPENQNPIFFQSLGIMILIWFPLSLIAKFLMIFRRKFRPVSIAAYLAYAVTMGFIAMIGPDNISCSNVTAIEWFAMFILLAIWPVTDLLDSHIPFSCYPFGI